MEVNWFATRIFDCGLTMANESGSAGIGGGRWEGVLGERESCGGGFQGREGGAGIGGDRDPKYFIFTPA